MYLQKPSPSGYAIRGRWRLTYMTHVRPMFFLLLAGLAALGCRSTSSRQSGEQGRMAQTPSLSQRMAQVPWTTAYQAALAVVTESYPIVQSSADTGLIMTGWVIGQAPGNYLSDLVVQGEMAARRKVRVEVQPWGLGSMVRVSVALERDVSAQARTLMDQTKFQDQPQNTPLQRGDYTSPSQQTLWRGSGSDSNEERRIMAAIVGRANLLMQTSASQPAEGNLPSTGVPAPQVPATRPTASQPSGETVPVEMTLPDPL